MVGLGGCPGGPSCCAYTAAGIATDIEVTIASLRFIEASTKGQESQNGRDWRRQARPSQLHRGSEFGFPRLNFGKGTPKSRVRGFECRMGLAAATSGRAAIRFRGDPLRRINAPHPPKRQIQPIPLLRLKSGVAYAGVAKRPAQKGCENGKMYRDDGDGRGDDGVGVSFLGAEQRHRRRRQYRHEQQRRSSSSPKKREHVTGEQMKARE